MTLTEDRPIFQQIAEQLEEAILSGAYPEESQVPSITEYSVQYRINPATALRFYQDYVQRMVREARNLGLTDQELLELLERGMKEDGH